LKESSISHSRNFELLRFVSAQNHVYENVVGELRAGQKKTHWMWFVFPQLLGLGKSPMAYKYAISGREEADAYLEHPTLGGRLIECSRLVVQIDGVSIQQVFGHPDYWKFRSCMTLFEEIDRVDSIFNAALDKFFDGERDEKTLEILAQS
jgi:uncharacterized protein (DUF1810 family)